MQLSRTGSWAFALVLVLASCSIARGAATIVIGPNGADDGLLADGLIAFAEPSGGSTVFLSAAAVTSSAQNLILQATDGIVIQEELVFQNPIDVTMVARRDISTFSNIEGCNDLTLLADDDEDGDGNVILGADVSVNGQLEATGFTIAVQASVTSGLGQRYTPGSTIQVDTVVLACPGDVELLGDVVAGAGVASVTIVTPALAIIQGDVGTERMPLISFIVQGGGDAIITSASIHAMTQQYDGSVQLSGDVAFDGITLTFEGPIIGTAGGMSDTLTVTVLSLALFQGPMQDDLASITVQTPGSGRAEFQGSGPQVRADGDVLLGLPVLISATSVTPAFTSLSGQLELSSVDFVPPSADLMLAAPTVRVLGDVGTMGETPRNVTVSGATTVEIRGQWDLLPPGPASLTILDGATTTIRGAIDVNGDVTFTGPVVVEDFLVFFNAVDVTFQSTIDAAAPGSADLIVDNAISVLFGGDVGTSIPLAELDVNAASDICLTGAIDASGQSYRGGALRLAGDVDLIGQTMSFTGLTSVEELGKPVQLDVELGGAGTATFGATPVLVDSLEVSGPPDASVVFGPGASVVTAAQQSYLVPIVIGGSGMVDLTGRPISVVQGIQGPATAQASLLSPDNGDIVIVDDVQTQLEVQAAGLVKISADVVIGQGEPASVRIDGNVELAGNATFDVPGGQVELLRDVAVTPVGGASVVDTSILTVNGDLTIGGELSMEIAGASAFDVVQVSGAVTIGSALNVTIIGDYVPAVDQSWGIIDALSRNGTFAAAFLPPLPSNRFMQIAYGAGGGGGVAGTSVVQASVGQLQELVDFDIDTGTQQTLPPGTPTALAVADFDGDGLDDLAVTVTGTPDPAVDPGSVLTFINQGTTGPTWNGFAAGTPAQITVGVDPSDVDAGDLDGSGAGFADLAVTNRLDDDVSVIPNAAGVFAAPGDVSTGNAPAGVAAAELTGDAFVDLVVTNELDDTFVILANDGGGGFTPTAVAAPTQTGDGPGQVDPADMDNDKDVDVVLVNLFSDTVQVFERVGGSMIGLGTPFGVGSAPKGLAIGDLDGDFLPEIIVTNSGSNDVSVLLNEGALSFAGAQSFDVGQEPGSIDLVDLEPDGDLDVVVVAGEAGVDRTLRALINVSTGPGEIQLVTAEPLQTSTSTRLVRRANLDDRGGDDIVVVTDETVAIAGAGGATVVPLLNTEIICGDADGDGVVGVPDLLVVLGAWGKCLPPCPPSCAGDLDDDCVVGVSDVLLVLGEWGAAVTGGCCFGDGTCLELSEADCALAAGVWNGAGTTCTPNECPRP